MGDRGRGDRVIGDRGPGDRGIGSCGDYDHIHSDHIYRSLGSEDWVQKIGTQYGENWEWLLGLGNWFNRFDVTFYKTRGIPGREVYWPPDEPSS